MEDAIFALEKQLKELWIARYIFSANIALIAYDYAIVLNQEHCFVWPARLSPSKVVYLLNRYVPIVSAMFSVIASTVVASSAERLCVRAETVSGMLCTLQFVVAEAALSFRAYAAWENNTIVGTLLTVVFLITTGFNYYFAYLFSRGVSSSDIGLLSQGCIIQGTSPVERNLIVLLLSEAFSFGLLLLKAFIHYRRGQILHSQSQRYLGPSIMLTMLKDGIAYFVCILGLTIGNILVNRFLEGPLQPVFVVLQVTVQNILCVRLYLHLRTRHWYPPSYHSGVDDMPLTSIYS